MSKKMILFVNVGVIVLFLIILEVGSRIIFGTTPNQAANAMISDNVMNHKWRPNSASVDTNWGIPFTIYVNKQSWLARYDITVSKPKNTIRIFYVGDSNTEGVVAEDKKMASIVSKGLNDTMKNRGKHIEVINTGTSSWSPSQYYLEIKDKILTYSPDIVIIDYDMSDVQNDGDYKKLTTFDNDGLPVAIRSSNVENKAKYRYAPKGLIEISLPQQMYIATLNFLNKNSSFFYHFEDFSLALKRNTFVRRLLFKPPKSKNPELDADNWLQYNWTKKAQENIDYSMFLLGKTISLLKEHNVKVIITSNPNYTQYTKEWNPHPHIVVEQTARKYGALYLNAYQALKSSITGSLRTTYYWEFDPTHFNEAGNRIWARAQLNFLLDPANKLFE